jgi:hypothetical protein
MQVPDHFDPQFSDTTWCPQTAVWVEFPTGQLENGYCIVSIELVLHGFSATLR